jgi:hypothetical protein
MEQLENLDRLELDRDFTEEDIKDVIFHMEKNKVVVLDGFPLEFFQSC